MQPIATDRLKQMWQIEVVQSDATWSLLPGPCFRRFAGSDIVRTEMAVLKHVVPRSVTKRLNLLMLLGDSLTWSYDYQQMQIPLSSRFVEQMMPSTTTHPVL